MTLYAVFGGADFGAGFWALLAGGGERGKRPRALIDWAIGPVWEANHVWLIFVLVVLWTAFSDGLRGDHVDAVHPAQPGGARDRAARRRLRLPRGRARGPRAARGRAAVRASRRVLTPFFMGTVVGAIASGRVPVGNAAGDPVTSWLNPLSLLVGALFVATGAYLAAVFLVSDARRAGDADLERYFTARALAAAVVAGALAVAGIFVLRADARYVYDGLTDRGPAAGDPLGRLRARRRWCCSSAARGAAPAPLAVGAVVAVIWGWGVAQFPYLLPTSADDLRRRRARATP